MAVIWLLVAAVSSALGSGASYLSDMPASPVSTEHSLDIERPGRNMRRGGVARGTGDVRFLRLCDAVLASGGPVGRRSEKASRRTGRRAGSLRASVPRPEVPRAFVDAAQTKLENGPVTRPYTRCSHRLLSVDPVALSPRGRKSCLQKSRNTSRPT